MVLDNMGLVHISLPLQNIDMAQVNLLALDMDLVNISLLPLGWAQVILWNLNNMSLDQVSLPTVNMVPAQGNPTVLTLAHPQESPLHIVNMDPTHGSHLAMINMN